MLYSNSHDDTDEQNRRLADLEEEHKESKLEVLTVSLPDFKFLLSFSPRGTDYKNLEVDNDEYAHGLTLYSERRYRTTTTTKQNFSPPPI